MRRLLPAVLAGGLVAGLIGVATAGSAGAQTGNLTEFCAARVALDSAFSTGAKAEQLAAFERIVANAPAAVVQSVTQIRDAFKKQGQKAFETEKLTPALATADSFVYENCPGAKVAVTAIDYQFQGMPTALKAGPTNFKLTNNAPKESHEMSIVKLTPAAAGQDVKGLLSLPEKKQGKYFDFSKATGMFAPPGQSGFTIATLEPGTYVYACFLPKGGKKNGAPHFTEGMYGSFTVS